MSRPPYLPLGVPALILLVACAPFSAHAQIKGARDYTKRIAPLLPPPPSPPPNRPAPVPARPPAQPAARPAPPADPEKTKAQKEEATRKTVEFQKQRASSGSATAQYDLGLRYLNGDGVPQDVALGRKWLAEAAKSGNTQAAGKLKELDTER